MTFVFCVTQYNYVDVANDLGVDPHLTFEAHIDNIVQKAARGSYTIFKSFQSRSTELLVRAFTTYVMPLLEVNLEVWSPHMLKYLGLHFVSNKCLKIDICPFLRKF